MIITEPEFPSVSNDSVMIEERVIDTLFAPLPPNVTAPPLAVLGVLTLPTKAPDSMWLSSNVTVGDVTVTAPPLPFDPLVVVLIVDCVSVTLSAPVRVTVPPALVVTLVVRVFGRILVKIVLFCRV